MILKEFSSYLNRPLELFEKRQKENFKRIFNIVYSTKEKEREYEMDSIGFLSPHENNYMKSLSEEKKREYTILLLFDAPMRKTNQVVECLIPTSLASKYNLENTYNLCIQFKKFKKTILTHKSYYGVKGQWPVIIIEDFEIINPIRLRLISAKESNEAQKLRNEILFSNIDRDVPPYVKLSILNPLFLSPKIESRSGIETKSLISNSTGNRFLINLDNYNHLIRNLIPPEISNCHSQSHRSDIVTNYVEALGDHLRININYPISKYYFNSICTPNQKEDDNINLRNISNNEIGINHQTKFKSYFSIKELIDKLSITEFYFMQDYLPSVSRVNLNNSLKLMKENQQLLYDDYVFRILNQLPVEPLSVSGKNRITNLAKDYCSEMGYKLKQGRDSYFNWIVRSMSENLSRVKTILNRSNFKMVKGLEIVYLESLQLNFDEIRESKDYLSLPNIKLHQEKITKIYNNIIRSLIINALKIRGNNAVEEDIIEDARKLGHNEKDIMKEILNLQKVGIIFKLNNIVYLNDKEI